MRRPESKEVIIENVLQFIQLGCDLIVDLEFTCEQTSAIADNLESVCIVCCFSLLKPPNQIRLMKKKKKKNTASGCTFCWLR